MAYDAFLRSGKDRKYKTYNDYISEEQKRKDAAAVAEMQKHNSAGDAERIRNQSKSNNGGYDFSAYGGNTNAYYNAMKNAGFTWNGNKGSNFSLASDPSLQPYTSNLDELRKLYGSFGGGGSVGYTQGFKPSQAYLDAMAYTQGMLDKINSGRTSYSDKIDEMMDKIANREKFSYDPNTDPLFQNVLASAMASGQTAMQDTIGQASALTGGYGSSYATSAGNQQYNEFVKGAYEKVPDYYGLALNKYNMEGQELYNQLGMYRDADNTEYGRLTTAYGLNYQQARDMYSDEYNNFWQKENFNQEAAKFNAQQSLNNAKFKYEQYKDALARQDALKSASSTTNSTSTSKATSTEINAMKSDIKAMAEKGMTNQIDEYLLRQWNAGLIDENDIKNLYAYMDAVTPEKKMSLTKTAHNGGYVYTDQFGKAYSDADRTLRKVKTASNADNDEYQDAYGNVYTKSELKAIYGKKDWDKYVVK